MLSITGDILFFKNLKASSNLALRMSGVSALVPSVLVVILSSKS